MLAVAVAGGVYALSQGSDGGIADSAVAISEGSGETSNGSRAAAVTSEADEPRAGSPDATVAVIDATQAREHRDRSNAHGHDAPLDDHCGRPSADDDNDNNHRTHHDGRTHHQPTTTTLAPTTAPPTVQPAVVPFDSDVAIERFSTYLITAAARRYDEAWAMLSAPYQAKYLGYDNFVAFWETVDGAGIYRVDAARSDPQLVTLRAEVWYGRRRDGTRSDEIIEVDLAPAQDLHRVLIADYRFLGLR